MFLYGVNFVETCEIVILLVYLLIRVKLILFIYSRLREVSVGLTYIDILYRHRQHQSFNQLITQLPISQLFNSINYHYHFHHSSSSVNDNPITQSVTNHYSDFIFLNHR
jgi:hypothetical protein